MISADVFRRWMKFNCVGAIGVAVQLGTLAILKSGLRLNYLVATVLAVQITVLHNFVWHERFTWADRTVSHRCLRLVKFSLTTGAFSIAGNVAAMKVLVGMCGLNYLAANIITIATCSLLNFVVSDRFVFGNSAVALAGYARSSDC